MVNTNYSYTGYRNTYGQYGLLKQAAPVAAAASFGSKVLPWLQRMKPTKAGVKNLMIGDPKKFWGELRAGKAFSRGGMIRDSFKAPTLWEKGLFYGLPAKDVVDIARDDQGDKGRRMAGSLASSATGLALWRPLGMLGSMPLTMAAGALGGGIGGTIDRATGNASAQQPQQPQYLQQPQVPQYLKY